MMTRTTRLAAAALVLGLAAISILAALVLYARPLWRELAVSPLKTQAVQSPRAHEIPLQPPPPQDPKPAAPPNHEPVKPPLTKPIEQQAVRRPSLPPQSAAVPDLLPLEDVPIAEAADAGAGGGLFVPPFGPPVPQAGVNQQPATPPAPKAQEKPPRLPVPSKDQQQRTLKELDETYRPAERATTVERLRLAQELLELGKTAAKKDPAERFQSMQEVG
jgi:hypothetical protein